MSRAVRIEEREVLGNPSLCVRVRARTPNLSPTLAMYTFDSNANKAF